MSYTIEVSESQNSPVLFAREFQTERAYRAVSDLMVSRRAFGPFEAMVIPVRTHTLRGFCEDFFFPTVVLSALRVNGLVEKIFLCIGAFIWDILTLPVRIVTLLPRLLYNYLTPTHPFYQYLVEQGADTAILQRDFVYVRWRVQEGYAHAWRGETFNFLELPQEVTGRASEYRVLTVVA